MRVDSINERVSKIKNSDDEINKFVEEYKPFIGSCVEKSTGHFVRFGEDDEASIGLLAFVEAIQSYDISKGHFLMFSQNVIKRRLIDYYRKERKHSKLVSINSFINNEDGDEIDFSVGESLDRHSIEEINEYRKLELQELKNELSQWDISFFDLTNVSPKHDKTRKSYADIIKYIMKNPELINQIKQKKILPIAEIEKNTCIPRKTIERSRKYILAVIIILTGDYQYVTEYISPEVMK